MEKVTIRGQEYEILFDMYALEKIREKYGNATEVMKGLQNPGNIDYKLVRELFVIMANAARDYRELPEDITDKPLRHLHVEDFQRAQIWEKLVIEFANGWRSETTGGGEADDAHHDAYLEEDAKNAETGAR